MCKSVYSCCEALMIKCAHYMVNGLKTSKVFRMPALYLSS